MTQETAPNNKQSSALMRFVVILILGGVLFGLNALYQLVILTDTVQQGEAGELVYAAGFDGFADEWQQYEGRRTAMITDGVMRMALEIPDTIYSPAPPVYADFDARVTVQSIDGMLQNDGYGMIFRLNETDTNGQCQRSFVVLCTLEDVPVLNTAISLLAPAPQPRATGYYLFLISNDGYYQILRSNPETNQVEPATIWHYSNGLLNEGLGAENRIRVVGEGDTFRFFLNGEPALLCVPLAGEQPTGDLENCFGEQTYIWQDDTYPQGKLGLVLNGASNAGDIIEFDNFTVTIPAEIIIEGNNA